MPDREHDELLYRQAMHLASQLPINLEDRKTVLRYMRELCDRRPCEAPQRQSEGTDNVCRFERRSE